MKIKRPRLASSIHGKINHILMVLPNGRSDNNCYRKLLEKLLIELPDYTKFVIWVYPSKEILEKLEDLLTRLKLEYFYYEHQKNALDLFWEKKCCILKPSSLRVFSAWIQDFFLVVVDDLANQHKNLIYHLIEPYDDSIRTDEDHIIANELANIEVFKSHNVPLIFHGGNILCGDDFVLYGRHHFQQTRELLNNSKEVSDQMSDLYFNEEAFIKNVIASYLGGDKKIIPVGGGQGIQKHIEGNNNSQPLVHLDMYITLAGRNDQDKYVVLVANPIAGNRNDEAIVRSLKPKFDETASQLRDEGFIVIRNPMPLTRSRVTKGGTYYCLYNNCLVEVTKKSKKVWLPFFGTGEWKEQLKEYDLQNIHIWRALGFEVIELINGHPFARRSGGIHCLVKYLNRSNK